MHVIMLVESTPTHSLVDHQINLESSFNPSLRSAGFSFIKIEPASNRLLPIFRWGKQWAAVRM